MKPEARSRLLSVRVTGSECGLFPGTGRKGPLRPTKIFVLNTPNPLTPTSFLSAMLVLASDRQKFLSDAAVKIGRRELFQKSRPSNQIKNPFESRPDKERVKRERRLR